MQNKSDGRNAFEICNSFSIHLPLIYLELLIIRGGILCCSIEQIPMSVLLKLNGHHWVQHPIQPTKKRRGQLQHCKIIERNTLVPEHPICRASDDGPTARSGPAIAFWLPVDNGLTFILRFARSRL